MLAVGLDESLRGGTFIAHEQVEGERRRGRRPGTSTVKRVREAGFMVGVPELLGGHFAQALVALDVHVPAFEFLERIVLFSIGVHPALVLTLLDAVQRRLGDIQPTMGDELGHVAEEEG